jgi:hypothetical protein
MGFSFLEEKLLLDEMKRIVVHAESRGAKMRGLGAGAIRTHSLRAAQRVPALRRELTDLDFITYSKQERLVMDALAQCGYPQDRARAYIRSVSGRSIVENPQTHLVVDLFFDRLAYNHTIELNGRLEQDPLTIPIADLLLEKTQIVQINEKDVKDTILLLLEHPLGSGDTEMVNVQRVCSVLSNDWGFYYTVTNNLRKISDYVSTVLGIGEIDGKDARSKIDQLLSAIESAPKSMGWRMRAGVGPKRKWYKDVEDLVAGH